MAALPQDEPIEVSASLICTSGSGPARVIQAVVRHYDGSTYDVEAPDGTVATGTGVVLDFGNSELPLVRARVVASDGDRLRLEVLESRSRDLREFPRMAAGITMRYLRVPPTASDDACAGWLTGGDAPAGASSWQEPDPLMEFSASGLAFNHTAACDVDDRLLVELEDPAGDGAWRGLGHVVRAEPRPEQGTWSIAIALTGLPPEAVQALLEFTVKLQEHQAGDADA